MKLCLPIVFVSISNTCNFPFRWVMTAAHCVSRKKARKVAVVLGEHHLKQEEEGEVRRKVSKVIPHPHYGGNGLRHDIALLK